MASSLSTQYRPHGFQGQRMVVLPPDVVKAYARHPLLAGLMPTDAGFFASAQGHRVMRPRGTPEHVMIVCLVGRGWYRTGDDGQIMAVSGGSVLLLPPGVPHAYGTDDTAPWSIVWAHFVGSEAPAWRETFGLGTRQALVRTGLTHAGEIGLDRVHAQLEQGYGLPHLLIAAAALRSSLAELKRRASIGEFASTAHAVMRSLERSCERPGRRLALAELAAGVGLSVSHYSMLVRAQTGFSPIEYLLRMRLQKATLLLETGDLSVEAIATTLGYRDANYFSRQFKKFLLRSPRHYRSMRRAGDVG